MLIHALNIGQKKLVEWRGKKIYTGIFKSPVTHPIILGFNDVVGDDVVDRKYHGGIDKACYAYSKEAYGFWQKKYPAHTLENGFFGENITIEGLDESKMKIGDRFEIGTAIIEVSQPRQPCFKLGIRFGSQKILKPFIQAPYPGAYFRVIQSGTIHMGHQFKLIQSFESEPTLLEVYQVIYHTTTSAALQKKVLQSKYLAQSAKDSIKI
ncbi:MOSC domain-containing protein [Putridiphycobacter roseus]|nr:MOSC domain-containing protein [Putridiphycobacter roseus]